jgi:carboxylesterase
LPQPDTLDPSAFSAEGGPIGALLIHGYTGSVAETRPMGEYLAAQGITVRCPLLPGHGTTPEDLVGVRWQAWADTMADALAEVQGRCPVVFVGGLSLGALLTLWLGARQVERGQSRNIAGLIAMAPAVVVRSRLLPLALGLRYLLKFSPQSMAENPDLCDPQARERIWCYDEMPLWGAAEVYLLQRQVRASLHKIRQPLLIFQGCRDARLPHEAAEMVRDRVASEDKTLVWLERSGHNLLADGERETVWSQSLAWMTGSRAQRGMDRQPRREPL